MSDPEENEALVRCLVDQVGRRESELASAGTVEHLSLGVHPHTSLNEQINA
jgi:hypothetical protein